MHASPGERRTAGHPPLLRTLLLLVTVPLALAGPTREAGAQTARRVATVAAIQNYPGFYHAQAVLVRGDVIDVETPRPAVSYAGATLRLLTRETLPSSGVQHVRGEVLDIGRLNAEDPRLSGIDLRTIGIEPGSAWPRQGEIVLLRATSFEPAERLTAPTVRALALDPERYVDQRVTVRGEFRGRNLYGDLPQAPAAAAKSRGEFVLRSADAAIWVLGKRPRGRGFSLDPESRIDTKRWLEVSGVVREERGLVWIEAADLSEVEPERHETRAEGPPAPPTPIPPEVRFSVPLEGETDVPPGTRVRVQFSRDILPETIKGRVRVSYLGAQSAERGEPQPPAIEAQIRYDPGARVMEISFTGPLERFRTVKVDLLEGITGTDGAPLAPWTLTFSVGG
jgi:Bacterial Ig-like domain